jgi:hypothetical protein
VTEPQDLDEWGLAGLTQEQGLARWSGVFAGKPPVSRMSVSTGWGWLTWEPTDSDTAHVARLAGRTPKPVLTEIAVRDPDSRTRELSLPPGVDPVTTSTWSALIGLIGGGAAGIWWWGLQLPTLVLAVAGAVGALGSSILWRRWSASRRPPVKLLTERDSAAPSVLAGAKIVTWVTDQLRIHEAMNAAARGPASGIPEQRPPEVTEAVYQLHRALWALATGGGDNARATLAEMTNYAGLVRQLLEARDRVRRASTVRVARPAPAPGANDSAAERLRDAGRRLDDAIGGQRHAADVIGDINRRFDDAG